MSERQTKYWICADCADAMKWVGPTWAVTVIKGLCGFCERDDEVFLTPVVDFTSSEREAVWD